MPGKAQFPASTGCAGSGSSRLCYGIARFSMKSALRFLSLAFILLVTPGIALWVHRSEMTHLWWVVFGSGIFSLLFLGLWYLVLGKAPFQTRRKRFGMALLAFVVLGFLASRTIRYEGSTSGSSFPKFAWTWSPRAAEAAPSVIETPPATTSIDLTGRSADLTDFLGPERDGMFEKPTFGTDWQANPPELIWRRPIGKGWSGFTVSGNRAFTQQQVGDDEHVTALDLATGADLWSHADPQTRLLLERAENGGAAMGGDGPRATPVLHNGRVYTMGGTGIINCLDLTTGEEIWSRHLLRELGAVAQRWGMASSPLVLESEGLVAFAGPDHRGASLVACDLATGETRWTHEGSGGSYSSARLMEFGGVRQIVTIDYSAVCGLDPATGKTLWSHDWPGTFPKVGQPIAVGGDRLLVTASYGVGSLLLKIQKAADGSFAVERLWKTTYLKTKFSSAAVIGDHAYGLDEGRLACIALADGKRVWKNEKFGFGQHLLFGSTLLVQTESGEVVVGTLDPGRFTESGRLRALSSMTWNPPTVAGRVLLVRNDLEAAAYLLPAP